MSAIATAGAITTPTGFPSHRYAYRDDFAGPGGWDVAMQRLGLSAQTLGVEWSGDACETATVAGLHRMHADVRQVFSDADTLSGYIASPPCQSFSAAGKGAGRRALDSLLSAVNFVADGDAPESAVSRAHDEQLDERSVLVLHPLTVIRDARPTWVALEQVPAVLPVWERYASWLRTWGYSVETATLNAEQYGVPQTRRRAVLLASLDHQVSLPSPTHSRYYPRDRQRLDAGVLPWVSMAQALGGTPGSILRSNYGTGGDPAARGERGADEPAFTVTSKVGRNKWLHNGNQANSAIRPDTSPAPTMHFGARQNAVTWQDSGDLDPRQTRVAISLQGVPASVRVSVAEAGVFQSFPLDHPWQGVESSQYEQVGNAIPPLLAEAILKELI